MKVILQAFEPMPQPFSNSSDNADVRPVATGSRKPRLRLQPVTNDHRLFHAL